MTERIRWREAEHGNLVGHVGTLDGRVFKIQRPVLAGERWVLTTTLPDWLNEVKGGSVALLKSTAKAWLEEFVSSLGASFGDEPVTEHAHLMSGGGYHVWNTEPYIEKIYPLEQRIKNGQQHGGHVYKRRVIVVEDWTELTPELVPPHPEDETTDA